MREKKFTRIVAFLLSMLMLLSSAIVATSAADAENGGSVTDISLEELRELLNSISYEEYTKKYADVARADAVVQVPIGNYTTDDEGFEMRTVDGAEALFTPSMGSVTWTLQVPKTAKYAVKIEYYPDQNRAAAVERTLQINGKVPFNEARFLSLPKRWENNYVDATLTPGKGTNAEALAALATEAGYKNVTVKDGKVVIPFQDYITEAMSVFADDYGLRYFQRDIKNNELRPTTVDRPKWMTYYLKDSTGYYTTNFEFYFEEGENTITLESQNEPMSIKAITLYPLEDVKTYEQYIAQYEGVAPGSDVIKVEGENASVMSDKTIYAIEDRSSSINSPTDVTCSLLNTVGGEKWATPGQWVEYRFRVETTGMYDLVTRFRQNFMDGMYACRAMSIYSEGLNPGDKGFYDGTPFTEAATLVYSYSDDWQVGRLNADMVYDSNGNGKIDKKDKTLDYSLYLEAGVTYTVRFEVTLGKMGDIVRRVEKVLNSINNDYLEIIKLTGVTPDSYRDYGFSQIMPHVMVDMVICGRELEQLALELTEIGGGKSSNVATLEKMSEILRKMGTDDDQVAKNLSNLKSYVGTLGTFLSNAKTQPLQIDYMLIQPAGEKLPAATPNFFQVFMHEVMGFFQSFIRDYDSMGALVETSTEATQVWLASGRDQTQVIRNLINNDFTPNSGIAVNLKLVAGGTLLPSILSGSGPDIYLGLGSGDVINYAIRSAVIHIDDMPDFESYVEANYTDAAMLVLGIEDADQQMHYYGLPESQGFSMMYVRIDIFADFGLEIPKTWDDVMACIPTFQANNMMIGLPSDYAIFLYQQGGDLFADDGMRVNLDSKLGLAAFEKMCNLFTMYSFPIAYDGTNRFRTGEMPLILGDYCGLYNQLKVFATEIEGKWKFVPMPGERQADGSINNVTFSGVSATVMIKGVEGDVKERAWEFMKWYNGENFQVEFSNEMIAILGPSAKQAVSNINALANLPWTTAEYEQIQLQFNNLAAVPNYPGAYIIGRYTGFAFLNAYNTNADPATSLLSYINVINKEIERKRNEFNLETLSDGVNDYKDLLTKRLAQLGVLVNRMRKNDDFKDEYEPLMKRIEAAIRSDDSAELAAAMNAVQKLYEQLDPTGELFIADRIKVMGYDMSDTSLTKAQKKKVRKCFSYEVYKNTDELYSQLKCTVDFLSDAVRLSGV